MITCGNYTIRWADFELGTRVLAHCIIERSEPVQGLKFITKAWEVIRLRGLYMLNSRPVETGPRLMEMEPLLVQIDKHWSIRILAWHSRRLRCKDDRNKVYALLSLTTGIGLRQYRDTQPSFLPPIFVPQPFLPDYARSVEWAYREFLKRLGGFTPLSYAALSRSDHSKASYEEEDIASCFNDDYLPSWCPELRET
jgi:hypothetical protein